MARRIFRMAKEINEMFKNARRPDQAELEKEAAEFERMMLERRRRNKAETLAAMRDADEGYTIGPFGSVEELSEALDAED